jgi:tRNA-2-methylthio-N6-dimethylallyladenosine synthase
MNIADSEKMLGLLQQENYGPSQSEHDADLIILNTCHIREKATHKVISRLGRLKDLKLKNPNLKVAVTGCVAQAEGKKLLDRSSVIDIIVGPGKIDDLPKLLKDESPYRANRVSLGFEKEYLEGKEQGDVKPTVSGMTEVSRYININQGCNNFCTFCVVPFTRGREISRQPQDIIAEVKRHIDSGAKEISLLGQNVNSYGLDLTEQAKLVASDNGPFVDLLEVVAQIPGLERLRYTTSNPHDFTKPLADLFARYPKLGNYMHLPVQSGNNEVLARMRRKVTREEYLERVGWLRAINKDFAISTDLIVGFPGETDDQFADTLSLVNKIRFSFIFAFKYSPRKNTAAARFKDQVPEEVKDQRLKALNELQDRITTELNQEEIGRTTEILCHYRSKKEPGWYYGRTPEFRLVRVPSQRDLLGRTVTVKIVDGNKTALVGEMV